MDGFDAYLGEVFSGGSDSKESTCNAGDLSSIAGLGRCPHAPSQRREWQPSLAFWPGEFCGQRSLVGYSPGGHKQSDAAE